MGHVTPTPAGTYRANWRDPSGNQKARTFKTKKAANAFVAEIETSKNRGTYVDPDAGKIKFAEFAARWLLGREVEARTAERTLSLLRAHLLPRWGRLQLAQIDYMSVQQWVVELGTKLAAPTVSKCYGLLKAILDTAVRARILPFNAADGIKVRREARDSTSRSSAITREEFFGQLLPAVPVRHRAIVCLAAGAGLRWGDVDAHVIRFCHTKRGGAAEPVADASIVVVDLLARNGTRWPVWLCGRSTIHDHVAVQETSVGGIVLPHLGGVVVERLESSVEATWMYARVRAESASCPGCQAVSTSVRSRYQRRLNDTPIGGRPVWLVLRVRRFNCPASGCPVRTFVEQVPGLTARRRRRSQPLQELLHGVGAALAGRAGVRLAGKLAMRVSRSTLLRLLRAAPEPVLTVAPRVLGVDDFALRRGQVYATILLDMETHRPIDVLPDREAETLAAWLRAHPGAEIICRDRAGAYADGARTGAPGAIQVADRWHIWHNLGEAVEAAVVAHRASLPEPPAEPSELAPLVEPASSPQLPEPPVVLPGNEIRLVTRTKERYREVQQLLADGASRAEVGRRLGLDIQTVRRFADATSVEQLLANTRRESLIDPYKAHLHQRWNDGCTDTAVLHAEIREQGFRGSVQTLRRHLQPFRPIEDGTRRHLRAPSAPPAPKPRRVAKWIMSDPAKIRSDDQQKLDAIRQRSPALDTLAGHVQDFADMMHKLRGDRLPQWIATVLAGDVTELHSFARGLQRDLAAATAGLTLPWSSGAVEGQVNRVKMLKRQMYGRARFDLLRRRILQPN